VVSDAYAGFDIVLLNTSAVSLLCLWIRNLRPFSSGGGCYPVNVSYYVGVIAELYDWNAKLSLRAAMVRVE
jgi:hypothetical protein